MSRYLPYVPVHPGMLDNWCGLIEYSLSPDTSAEIYGISDRSDWSEIYDTYGWHHSIWNGFEFPDGEGPDLGVQDGQSVTCPAGFQVTIRLNLNRPEVADMVVRWLERRGYFVGHRRQPVLLETKMAAYVSSQPREGWEKIMDWADEVLVDDPCPRCGRPAITEEEP